MLGQVINHIEQAWHSTQYSIAWWEAYHIEFSPLWCFKCMYIHFFSSVRYFFCQTRTPTNPCTHVERTSWYDMMIWYNIPSNLTDRPAGYLWSVVVVVVTCVSGFRRSCLWSEEKEPMPMEPHNFSLSCRYLHVSWFDRLTPSLCLWKQETNYIFYLPLEVVDSLFWCPWIARNR